jgi:bifunctional DNA-binding transcriptional regulator/antitoxin component of YhaV-PrlF toxin-antitoxin module
MVNLTANMDKYGKVLIPLQIREIFNIQPGDIINLEVHKNGAKVINTDQMNEQVIDEMHAVFTKHRPNRKGSIVEDFINRKKQEYKMEEAKQKWLLK